MATKGEQQIRGWNRLTPVTKKVAAVALAAGTALTAAGCSADNPARAGGIEASSTSELAQGQTGEREEQGPNFELDERFLGNIDTAYPYFREKLTALGSKPQEVISGEFSARLDPAHPESYAIPLRSGHGLDQLGKNYAIIAQLIQANPDLFRNSEDPRYYALMAGLFQDVLANTDPSSHNDKPNLRLGLNPNLYQPVVDAVLRSVDEEAQYNDGYSTIAGAVVIRAEGAGNREGMRVELVTKDGTTVETFDTGGASLTFVESTNPYVPYDFTTDPSQDRLVEVALVPRFQQDGS